ncbi:hypothetical protein [Clostridium beijerinckii]|uniref:hypothetical protein n=1 Tax=Clostridium beijerinckii TaxID=1520 RepID=UPI00098BFB8B|nr:hypothetical protein [Clostridium beijerinckii]NRT79454.1 hypothetical protein [Clostridium beijerinckii]OOM41536.1 hypothetical protein CBEIJ_44660 [Clostridium beijerinckii]
MIQLITDNYKSKINNNNVIISNIASPKSLDEFEVNIVDLNWSGIWECKANSITEINIIQDFINLNIMMKNSKKTKVVIVLPQNKRFLYKYNVISKRYDNSIELKNMLLELNNSILYKLLGFSTYDLMYENTATDIVGKDICSSFYFDCDENNIITKSKRSSKTTSILHDGILITTLELIEYEDIINLLRKAKFIQDKTEIPQWVLNLDMFDDIEQKDVINFNKKTISDCEEKIDIAQKNIDNNNKYKSILYTNGEVLVNIVFEMLQQLLNYDLSEFEDEKKEDFLIKKEDITFIGEIKGVTSNVKSEHVSQLDVHLQNYYDAIAEENIQEKVKSLLIMNHQRSYDLKDRQPVHENQIKLAERNGSLIIETYTLLKLFEMLKRSEITSDECTDLFKDRIGLLEL